MVDEETDAKAREYDEHSVSTASFLQTDVSDDPLMEDEEDTLILVIDPQMACVARTEKKYAGFPIHRRENERNSSTVA